MIKFNNLPDLKLYLIITIVSILIQCSRNTDEYSIDRYAVINRHIPVCQKIDPLSPFTVGNGEFAFTADITGLQTFTYLYEEGIPLVTLSNWGWHTFPNIHGYHIEQTQQLYDTYGRSVPYASITNTDPAFYLRSNPHRLHLGRIGFKHVNRDSLEFRPADISNIYQKMDIWEGIIKSSFDFNGSKMMVETCADPSMDRIAVRIQSKKLNRLSIGIGFDFPYGSAEWGKKAYDWSSPDKHTSAVTANSENSVTIRRELDSMVYHIFIDWKGSGRFRKIKPHSYLLEISSGEIFEFTCRFSTEQNPVKNEPGSVFITSRKHWQQFWESGGIIDLSKSAHPAANELERRIVLSQYLTAIQCSGSLPPQETGLTLSSWYGKFHLEMHWWHAVHFVLWGHPELLERSLPWYESILPLAREKAVIQGYKGVRWPKMTSFEGYDSPSGIGVFLIWQQPHPIYYAELLYRNYRNPLILKKYQNIVFRTAEFMASYAHWQEKNNRYVLGPPLIPAQEIYPADKTMNPTFELAYWAYGLKTAQIWRERLGLKRDQKWDHVLSHLSPLPVNNGFYQNGETAFNTFQEALHRRDHPTLLGVYGMLPTDSIDISMMQKTVQQVMASWDWQHTWGWDYPLIAMAAARVGYPKTAVEALLMDVQKNTYLNNGHNYQSDRLPVYLPGNGGLLTAVAMMAAGWDNAPQVQAPGFPKDGNWVVEFENLKPLP